MSDLLLTVFFGLGLVWIGLNIGILISRREVELATKLLNEAKTWHKQIENDLLRFQEQTRK